MTLFHHPWFDRQRLLTIVVWTGLGSGILLWGWLRIDSGQKSVADAKFRHTATSRDVQRILDLRSRGVSVAHGRRPDLDLVTRAQRALSDAGLPIAACSGIQPRTDIGNGSVRVQSVQLVLQRLTPGELGSWLAAWNSVDQPWQVSEIQLTHDLTSPANTPPTDQLDSNRYQATLLLAAPYHEDSP